MKKRVGLLFVLLATTAVGLFYISGKGISTAKNPESRGAQLYATYCVSCHGEQGKGDGKLAYLLYPKPRDFTQGTFKLRSTLSGQVPTDDDLVKTIRSGMPGTAMPSFHYLPEEQIRSVVQYVKSISQECKAGLPCKNFFQDSKPQVLKVPTPVPPSNELVVRGHGVYKQLGCFQCHGDYGKGDGISSSGLRTAGVIRLRFAISRKAHISAEVVPKTCTFGS